MNIFDLEFIGIACGNYRKSKNIPRHIVADKTGYTEQMIYKFEKGDSTNLPIFLWYIDMGLTFEAMEHYYNMMFVYNKSTGEYMKVKIDE